MLVTLYKNSTVGTGMGQAIVKAIASVLTGAVTTPSGLNSTYWTQSLSSFIIGEYNIPNYWDVEYDNSIASNTSGSITLSCNSKLGSTRKNYIQFEYTSGNTVNIYTGARFDNNVLLMPAMANVLTGSYGFTGDFIYNGTSSSVANNKLYIRFADGFVHIWLSGLVNSLIGHSWVYNFLGVEISHNEYDIYSNEATFKSIGFGAHGTTAGAATPYGFSKSMNISSYYAPKTDTYTANKSISGLYGGFVSDNTLTLSKNANTVSPDPALCNIVFKNLTDGWLGADISELAGIYLASNSVFIHDDVYTLGKINYKIISPPQVKNTILARY